MALRDKSVTMVKVVPGDAASLTDEVEELLAGSLSPGGALGLGGMA